MGVLLAQYFTHIGKPVDFGLCDQTIKCLNAGWEDLPPYTSWHCNDDCRGATYVKFVGPTHDEAHINYCLNGIWFGGVSTFNCPGY